MSDNSISKAAFLRWFKPLIAALKDLGGSGTPDEVRQQIIKNENLTDEELQAVVGKTNTNKFENEVAWARNYLVIGGYIDKSVKGIWSLTDKGKNVEMTMELASDIFKEGIKGKKKTDTIQAADDESVVKTWLLTYNPTRWNWEDYDEAVLSTKNGKRLFSRMELCQQTRKSWRQSLFDQIRR